MFNYGWIAAAFGAGYLVGLVFTSMAYEHHLRELRIIQAGWAAAHAREREQERKDEEGK